MADATSNVVLFLHAENVNSYLVSCDGNEHTGRWLPKDFGDVPILVKGDLVTRPDEFPPDPPEAVKRSHHPSPPSYKFAVDSSLLSRSEWNWVKA